MNSSYHTKYRPVVLNEVLGQDRAVQGLKSILKKKSSHAFLFCGPSGVGKTTLARIIASHVECNSSNLFEIDAATHSGVDAMRAIAAHLEYTPLTKSKARVIIVDEAHALSRQAWQSLLKAVEEPPPDAYWIFCTTEAAKIPKTIETRCSVFRLGEVDFESIFDLLYSVNDKEKLGLTDDFLEIIANSAEGSPRRALTIISKCEGAKTKKDIRAICETLSEDSEEAVALCRALMQQASWSELMTILGRFNGVQPESIRLVLCKYFEKVAQNPKKAEMALAILAAFQAPFEERSGLTPLLISLGNVVFD